MENNKPFSYLTKILIVIAVLGIIIIMITRDKRPEIIVYKCSDFEHEAPKSTYCKPGKLLFVADVYGFDIKRYQKKHPKDWVYMTLSASTTGEQTLFILSDNLPDREFFILDDIKE